MSTAEITRFQINPVERPLQRFLNLGAAWKALGCSSRGTDLAKLGIYPVAEVPTDTGVGVNYLYSPEEVYDFARKNPGWRSTLTSTGFRRGHE